MSLYSSYSDEDLAAEIADLKARIIAAAKADGAGVRSLTGEGRRIEFSSVASTVGGLRDLLRQAEIELGIRNNSGGGAAIGVVF